MSILASLANAYDRLERMPAYGYTSRGIHGCIVLSSDGKLAGPPVLWHRDEKGKPSSRTMEVPYFGGRSGQRPPPYFLWDNTAYVLGVTAKSLDPASRHEAFKKLHVDALSATDDEELVAVCEFLNWWTPDAFERAGFSDEVRDLNFVFRHVGRKKFVHENQNAKAIWSRIFTGDSETSAACLISGKHGPIARLHPPIGSFEKEARIVSFNEEAYCSYGHERGDNAPVSELLAFKYTASLNRFLAKGSRNRIQIGDASTVFWADASNAATAQEAEVVFAGMIDDFAAIVAKFEEVNEEIEARKVGAILEHIRKGQPLKEVAPELSQGVRFHVLGLAPNAARLSVRYWLTDDFGQFAQRLAEHHADLRMDPPPMGWGAAPSVNRLLARTTAFQGKFENIPPLLAGEVMRAVLSGSRYPQSLLTAAIIRLRAGDPKSSGGKSLSIGWHAAVIRAVLFRDQRLHRKNPDLPENGETPMSLKRDHDNPGYQLGRLFAVYELAQRSALGKVNATIRDRYFGAASATPASVFPLIVRGGQPHLAKVRKEKPGWAVLIERELEEINGRFTPKADAVATWPRSLRLKDQGEFAIGYYHQRAAKLSNDTGEQVGFDDAAENTAEGDEE